MNKDLQDKLINKYPSLFKDRYNDVEDFSFTFECGDGWFDLIDDLCGKIVALGPNVYASQVKEKFGGLRFYVDNVTIKTSSKIFDEIRDAESKSFHICEKCGCDNASTRNSRGWLVTLCDSCYIT